MKKKTKSTSTKKRGTGIGDYVEDFSPPKHTSKKPTAPKKKKNDWAF